MNALLAIYAGAFSLGLTGPTLGDDLATCEKSTGERAVLACDRLVNSAANRNLKAGYYIKLRGMTHYRNQDYNSAIRDLSAVAGRNSLDPRLFMKRADAYHFTGQYEKAVRDYGIVIRLKPSYARAYYNRAIANRKLERYKLAINDFSTMIELKPKDARPYHNRGHIFLRMNAADKAIPDFEQAVTLAPKDFNVHHSLGEGYYRAGKPDAARDVWHKSCQFATTKMTRNWQSRLLKAGHYAGPVDGVCDTRMIEAFSSCAANKCKF